MSRSPRAWTLALFTCLCTGLLPATTPVEGATPPIRPLRTGGLAADVAAIILSGQQGGDLPIAALATPMPRQEGGLSVPLSIEIDAGMLFDFEAASPDQTEEGEEPEPERLEIIVYLLGADGVQIQDSLLQAYAIDAHRLSKTRRGLRFVAELTMPRPPGTARVMARFQQREALGVVSLPIEGVAPELAAAPSTVAAATDSQGADGQATEAVAAAQAKAEIAPRLTPPLIPGDEAWLQLPWILPTGVLPPLPEPFVTEAMASKGIVHRGEPLVFKLLASGFDAVDSRMTLELVGEDGRLSAQVSGDVKSYSTPQADGLRELVIQADTADLPLGAYGLSAILTSGGAEHRSPPLDVLVLDDLVLEEEEQAEASPDAWPWLVARLTAPRAPTLNRSQAGATLVEQRQLTRGLDEVYGHLAEGNEIAARRSHLRLALKIAKDHGSLGLKAMGKEEFERAKMMAVVSQAEIDAGTAVASRYAADSVLPLVALNLELYRETRRLRRTLVSTHARFMALRLIELYLSSSSNPAQAQRTAASLFVSLGGELQLADMVYFSERMFRKALTYDANQTTALLALGMNYHLIGDLQRARDSFQALLAIDPDHVEGNLRLSRLEMLEQRPRKARRLLERAVRGEGPEWSRAVAYQELARLDIDDGNLDEARKTLEKAIQEHPSQPRLLILLAFVHDAKAASAEARDVLAQTSAEASARPSPRRRFVDWSRESFVRNDRRVQERVNRAVPVLAERWQVFNRREQR